MAVDFKLQMSIACGSGCAIVLGCLGFGAYPNGQSGNQGHKLQPHISSLLCLAASGLDGSGL